MGHSSDQQSVIEFTFECDNCGIGETVSVPADGTAPGAHDARPKGWMICADPGGDTDDLTFHTRRCAIGWFRAFVAQRYNDQDDEPQEVDGSAYARGDIETTVELADQASAGL